MQKLFFIIGIVFLFNINSVQALQSCKGVLSEKKEWPRIAKPYMKYRTIQVRGQQITGEAFLRLYTAIKTDVSLKVKTAYNRSTLHDNKFIARLDSPSAEWKPIRPGDTIEIVRAIRLFTDLGELVLFPKGSLILLSDDLLVEDSQF